MSLHFSLLLHFSSRIKTSSQTAGTLVPAFTIPDIKRPTKIVNENLNFYMIKYIERVLIFTEAKIPQEVNIELAKHSMIFLEPLYISILIFSI